MAAGNRFAEQRGADLTLRPARIDFLGAKTDIIIAGLIALLVCIAVYSPTLSVGFLLDDFLHLDYVSRAASGDWSAFLANFTGNWAGSDIMKSYRPFVSLTLFLDYLVWGNNAWGFHLTNILLTALAAFFVGLVTTELSGLSGNRLASSAAIWASLLFCLYPLHPEATAWIIGRVDLLCTVFYLTCLYYYLRYRLVREKAYLYFSLLSFIAAILCKEMAATLPLTITAAECLLYKDEGTESRSFRFSLVFIFWLLFALIAGFRILILGTLVGGYESNGAPALFLLLKNFLDKSSLLKIFFPLHEEVKHSFLSSKLLSLGYFLSLFIGLTRLITRSANWRVVAFLLFWTVISILPTYQIWHIYPNLVGSRLFYLSSAPFVILLSFAALPSIDKLPKVWARISAIAGILALSLIVFSWSAILKNNLTPWTEAGKRMSGLRAQLHERSKDLNGTLLLLNLPTDYAGAGMLTRPSYLKLLSSPPLCQADFSQHLTTIEPEISGSHDFLWPDLFKQKLQAASHTLIWEPQKGTFIPFSQQHGASRYDFFFLDRKPDTLKISPQNFIPTKIGQWTRETAPGTVLEQGKDFIRLKPGSQTISLVLPALEINPLMANFAKLNLELKNKKEAVGKIKLLWQTENNSPNWQEATLSPDSLVLWLGRYRTWILADSIKAIGLKFLPGDYEVELKSLQIESDKSWKPEATLIDSSQINYKIPQQLNPRFIRMFVTAAGGTFDANSEAEVDSPTPANSGLPTILEYATAGEGKLTLPESWLKPSGLHQIRLQALSSQRTPIGLPSEPITILGGESK